MKTKKCGCEKNVFACQSHAHPQTAVTPVHTPKWEARPKTSMGNFMGFRVFCDGVKMAEHVNALSPEEAIEKVKAKGTHIETHRVEVPFRRAMKVVETQVDTVKVTHTPTPWHVEVVKGDAINIYPENRNEGWIANCGQLNDRGMNELNAAFIVHAVNLHDKLIRALKGARQVIRKSMPLLEAHGDHEFAGEWLDEINEAIREAEGR